jgi:hypothetical protein
MAKDVKRYDMGDYVIFESLDGTLKWLRSKPGRQPMNYNFNYATGGMAMWGETRFGKCPPGWMGLAELRNLRASGQWAADDAEFCPYGPEILDMEVTTICKGPGGIPCPFCYKGNSPKGTYMPFETFKAVFDKINEGRILTQLAFGVDAQAESNPDLWKMMDYCRRNSHNKVIPNLTVADITEETAMKIACRCGAVAVSRYADKELCYNSIAKLAKTGMTQINIHVMASKETLPWIYETVRDAKTDPRLANLNAIVFLSLKKKGRGVGYNSLTSEEFSALVKHCMDNQVRIGFDSCSGPKFLNAIKGMANEVDLAEMCIPCESSLLSSYVNELGVYYPCSFCEGAGDWNEGIDVKTAGSFIKDVWMHVKTCGFRDCLQDNCRNCPMYEV